MGIAKLLGLVLLVGGAIALYFGFNATESLGEQVVEGVTGRFTDDTMTYLIGGRSGLVGFRQEVSRSLFATPNATPHESLTRTPFQNATRLRMASAAASGSG